MRKNDVLKVLILIIAIGIPLSTISYEVSASSWYDLVEVVELSHEGDGVAEWSMDTAHSGGWSINLAAPGKATWNSVSEEGEDVSEGRIIIKLAPETTLGDIESLSWWVNTTAGYPPHADLLLDIDGNGVFDGGKKDLATGGARDGKDDVLVFEFAYQSHIGPGYEYISPGIPYGHYDPALQSSYYSPSYENWVQTFQNEAFEIGTVELNNDTVCWLYSGLPGPYTGGYFGTMKDFKEKTVQVIGGTDVSTINSSTIVLEIHMEVDNWLGAADANVDDIALNGEPLLSELETPVVEVLSPEHITYEPGDIPVEINTEDIFGVEEIWFNVMSGGEWLYPENQTYTGPTILEDMGAGEYWFYAWARNTLGIVESSYFKFFVWTSELTVDIHPETLNLKSRGRWVTVYMIFPEEYSAEDIDIYSIQLEVNGEEIGSVWGRAENGVVMVKFSRSELQELIEEPGEMEVRVTSELEGGGSFKGSDTIRVINPGKQNLGPQGMGQRNQMKNQKGNNPKWNHRWQKGNNGKSEKNKNGGI